MKYFIEKLLGYQHLSTIVGEWEEVAYLGTREVVTYEYAKFKVFYSEKKERYKVSTSGYKPELHPYYPILSRVIEQLNTRSIPYFYLQNTLDFHNLWSETLEKESGLKNFFQDNFNPESIPKEAPDGINILKLGLDNYKDALDYIVNTKEDLIRSMQKYKNSTLTPNPSIDVWQDLGNVIITSDGCYFTAYSSQLKINDDEPKSEDPDNEE